jgi:hypothetical protein
VCYVTLGSLCFINCKIGIMICGED